MRVPTIAAAALPLLLHAIALPAQEVLSSSYVAPDGSRVLQHSIVVPASVADVWEALTTTEGVRSWAVPVASVDFRLGGIWESSYRLDGRIGDPDNIRNRFISYLPLRMVAIQAEQAPPGFPHAELLPELFTVIELEEVAPDRTRVRSSGVGYREGEGYDVLYRHFDTGNAWSLQMLHKRFAEGSIDWQALLGSPVVRQVPRFVHVATVQHRGVARQQLQRHRRRERRGLPPCCARSPTGCIREGRDTDG